MDFQTERVASSVPAVGPGPPAGKAAVVAAPKLGVVLSPPSPPAAEQLPEVGEDDRSHFTSVGLHYRRHRYFTSVRYCCRRALAQIVSIPVVLVLINVVV